MSGYSIRTDVTHAVERPLWQALAAAPAPASVAELHLACSAHPNAIQHRLTRWHRAGFIHRIEGRPLRFAMSDHVANDPEPPSVSIQGRATPRKRSGRARIWSAMRVLKTFDVPQLRIAASCTRRSVEDYINCLARAGYVRVVDRGDRAGSWAVYRLVRNTGPKAPGITHTRKAGDADLGECARTPTTRTLIDRNNGQRHDISPGTVRLRPGRGRSQADADRGEN